MKFDTLDKKPKLYNLLIITVITAAAVGNMAHAESAAAVKRRRILDMTGSFNAVEDLARGGFCAGCRLSCGRLAGACACARLLMGVRVFL